MQYLYHSSSNFLLFVELNRLKVRLSIYQGTTLIDDNVLIRTYITNTSEPWLVINADASDNTSSSDDTSRSGNDENRKVEDYLIVA